MAGCPANTVCSNEEYLFKCVCKAGYTAAGILDGAAHVENCKSNEASRVVSWLSIFSILVLLMLLIALAFSVCYRILKKNQKKAKLASSNVEDIEISEREHHSDTLQMFQDADTSFENIQQTADKDDKEKT